MTDAQLLRRVALLKRLAVLALVGFVVLVVSLAFLSGNGGQIAIVVLAALAMVPAFVYLILLTIWHWKGRYRGTHSDLWGGLLVLETSGWFKLVYLFRHILPDARGTGRYSRSPLERAA